MASHQDFMGKQKELGATIESPSFSLFEEGGSFSYFIHRTKNTNL
jgi:hypothetical protein